MSARSSTEGNAAAARGLHAAWSAVGFPASFLGKLVVAMAVAAGVPLVVAGALWDGVAADVGPVVWFGGATLVALALTALVLAALLAPIRAADRRLGDHLERHGMPPGPAIGDVASSLAQRVDALITELDERAALIDEVASADDLTSLPNRLAAIDRLRHNLHLAARDHLPLTLALLDIDDLEAINTAHGYGLGDRVLTGVGQRLEQLLRGSDWAARWGGDEFLVVLFAGSEGASIALERVQADIAAMRLVAGDRELRCTVTAAAVRARPEDRVHSCISRLEAAKLATMEEAPSGLRVID